jgi:periplasmic protein TonB
VRLPLALSLAGHALCLLALTLFAGRLVPLVVPTAPKSIELTFAPALPAATPIEPTPPPEAAPIAAAPEVPTVEPDRTETATEPPPPKPETKPQPRPAPRPPPTMPAPAVAAAPAAPVAAPPPVPTASAEVSSAYRAALAAWFESHKRYPDLARQRGEEGRVVLRFVVDRSGHVVDHAIVQGSGFADLDAAVDAMVQGAAMPPFPAGMTEPQIQVSIAIRFSMAR